MTYFCNKKGKLRRRDRQRELFLQYDEARKEFNQKMHQARLDCIREVRPQRRHVMRYRSTGFCC